jgi:hypothetical protein
VTDRLTVDNINSEQLDALQLKAARMDHATKEAAQLRVRLEDTEAERDGAYRERAQLLALLATMTRHPVIAPAPDVDEPGWQILYLSIGGRQATWHIAPRDADLFTHVENAGPNDPRAIWDGHTTEEKYRRIADHIAHRWYTPPAHYRRSDGVNTCVHTIPVGPDSCWDCRDLTDLDAPKEH